MVIVWLLEPLFPSLSRLHSVFEMTERHTRTPYGDELSIHVLQLGALPLPGATGYDAVVERWARFFTRYHDDAELDRLAAEDPMMALAKQTLDQISQDPETRRLAREREDAIKLYEIELAANQAEGRAEGKAEGRAEGRAEGKAELLLRLIGKRFGAPSDAVRARVQAASAERLDVWAERMLSEATLDDVLAP